MKKIALIAGALLVATSTLSADAFSKCAGCHGTNGEKKALGKSKVINTFTKAEIVTAINGYKDGSYGGAMKGLMKGQVSSLSDADIKFISEKIGK